jgi:hypothetical protein
MLNLLTQDHYSVSKRLATETPNFGTLTNMIIPPMLAHYEQTGLKFGNKQKVRLHISLLE